MRLQDSGLVAQEMTLSKQRYGFGCSWVSPAGRTVDIDLQCVVVDTKGAIVDCAYYNNLKAAKGSITHSGDETGSRGGIEEMVWVNLRKLPANTAMLVFLAAAHSGGKLGDVKDATFHILEVKESEEVATINLCKVDAAIDIVATMCLSDMSDPTSPWKVSVLDVAAQGRHFMDILPTLCKTIQSFIPSAPKQQKVAFAMEKGAVLDLPMSLNAITVGLGWDVDDGEVDLDVSAVLLDGEGHDVEAVFFGRLESQNRSVQHTGDNLTGEGDGDDEQILVSLDDVDTKVQQIVFVVNIYTRNRNFQQVAAPYCRVIDNAAQAELCRYALRDAGRENGLIISRMVRETGGRWGFHALGLPCQGRTYKDSLFKIKQVSQMKTKSLVLQRSPSMGTQITTATTCTPSEVVAFPPPHLKVKEGEAQACCTLM